MNNKLAAVSSWGRQDVRSLRLLAIFLCAHSSAQVSHLHPHFISQIQTSFPLVGVLHILHLSLNRESRFGTTDDFTTSFLHFCLFSSSFWDLANYRPVHSQMLSFHLFLYLPCLHTFHHTLQDNFGHTLMNGRQTCPHHCNLRIFTMVRRPSCGTIACWILARTSSFLAWSLYEMYSIMR